MPRLSEESSVEFVWLEYVASHLRRRRTISMIPSRLRYRCRHQPKLLGRAPRPRSCVPAWPASFSIPAGAPPSAATSGWS